MNDSADFNWDDAYRLRARQEAEDARASRRPGQAGEGASSAVLQTYALSSYPASAASFYACKLVGVFGTEAEGAAGTLTAGNGPVYALNLGSAIPPSGTNVLATFTNFRWVFRYDG